MPDPFANQLAVLMGLIQQKLAAAQLGQPTGPADQNWSQPPQNPQAFWNRQMQYAAQDPGIYGGGAYQQGDPVWQPIPQPVPTDEQGRVASVYGPRQPGTIISEGPSAQMAGREEGMSGPSMGEAMSAALPLPGDWRTIQNLSKASDDLALTPQERNLYNHHLNNLYGPGKVIQPNGDISTVEQMVVTGPDSKYYNIPSVWNGRELDAEQARQLAAQTGWNNWPSYDTPQEADARYQRMHKYIDDDARDYRAIIQEQ